MKGKPGVSEPQDRVQEIAFIVALRWQEELVLSLTSPRGMQEG